VSRKGVERRVTLEEIRNAVSNDRSIHWGVLLRDQAQRTGLT
jgi:hypothetical protein